ncbi:hypothetical protein DNTS_003822 [Danionella cerebrum]|uniref:Uncharacterized protein n=1 Tax=Danionella cerebrum TaxID=2873325 RepID=A0A553PVN2_9TELE|nr:hypothetical protein DNTS_003822 [Danionella translucida]
MLQPQPQPPIYPLSYPNQAVPQAVVTVQPAVRVTTAPLPDYLCYSIFTMICCCLPLGLAALIFSISLNI